MDLQLTSVFQNIPAGIYVSYIDEESAHDCVPMMINDFICQMTEFSRMDISEKFNNRFSHLIYKEDRAKYHNTIRALNDFPHTVTLQYRLIKKNGELLPVTDRIQSVRQQDGNMWIYACLIPSIPAEPSIKPTDASRRVEIKTFGYFNVLVDGQQLVFHSDKAKELLALLVDRKGHYVSNREIITCLWENEPVNKITQARCRKVVFNLRNTLETHGLGNLIESKVKGYRRLNIDSVICDLYLYLSGDTKYDYLFQGSYMEDYSWAENTLSNLLFED